MDGTRPLHAARAGDPGAAAALMELVYGPLRALAGRYLRKRAAGTLQPTSLVHEVFTRLADRERLEWSDQAHFFAVCATAMRGILVDHARRRTVRGGGRRPTTIAPLAPSGPDEIDVLTIDELLTRLEALDPRQAKVVEYRYFAGMSIPEVAETLGVSARTVDEDWAMARAWLSARLSGER